MKKAYFKAALTNFFNDFKGFVSSHKKILTLYTILCLILIPISWQQDVYDWYFVVGKLLSEGKNVYEPLNIQAIIKRGDTGRWGYPPFFLPFFSFSYVVSAFINLPFHVVYKSLVAFVNILVAMELEKIAKSSRVVALYLFNPLIIVSTIIQGFFDVLVIFLILLALKSLNKKSSATYMGLSSLCKQTAWPLIPFFLVLNLNIKWILLFMGVIIGGVVSFIVLDFHAIFEALFMQSLRRVGIYPWEFLFEFGGLDNQLLRLVDVILIAVQLFAITLLTVIIRIRLRRTSELDKVKTIEYFLLYELIALTFVYFLIPPNPHFLSYLLFPTIILMTTYTQFKYPYVLTSVGGYVVFSINQGLRHNIFRYPVWAGPEYLAPPIYLGYYHLRLFEWIIGGCLSIVMYVAYVYAFIKIWRSDMNCTKVGD